jgi:hypothetical protein
MSRIPRQVPANEPAEPTIEPTDSTSEPGDSTREPGDSTNEPEVRDSDSVHPGATRRSNEPEVQELPIEPRTGLRSGSV